METTTSTLPVKYEQSENDLIAAVESSKGLTIAGVEDRKGYAAVHAQRMKLKGYRTAIEAQRKDLKADALEWGRRVDAEAKRLTALIEPTERELEAKQTAIDAERERIKAEAEAAARAKLDGRVAAFLAIGVQVAPSVVQDLPDAEFDEMLKTAQAEHAARTERERIAAEEAAFEAAERERREAEAKRVERERLAKERAELERQRAEQAAAQKRLDDEAARVREEQRAAQAKLDAERAAFEAQREAAKVKPAPVTEPETPPLFPEISEAGPVLGAVRAEVLAECDGEDEREAIEGAAVAYFARSEADEVRRIRFLEVCADRTTSSTGDERLAYMALGYLAGMRAERARKAEGS